MWNFQKHCILLVLLLHVVLSPIEAGGGLPNLGNLASTLTNKGDSASSLINKGDLASTLTNTGDLASTLTGNGDSAKPLGNIASTVENVVADLPYLGPLLSIAKSVDKVAALVAGILEVVNKILPLLQPILNLLGAKLPL